MGLTEGSYLYAEQLKIPDDLERCRRSCLYILGFTITALTVLTLHTKKASGCIG